MKNNMHKPNHGMSTRTIPGVHEWEMIEGFVLSLGMTKVGLRDCMLAPLNDALGPLGLNEQELCEISAAVEQAGEEMRCNCPDGKLDCVNIRVYVTRRMLKEGKHSQQLPSLFFIDKQIVSSESDNLMVMENPACFIDLYVYPSE
jgi:hypothetical protein